MSDVSEFIAASCRICGKEFRAPIVSPLQKRRKEARTHLKTHMAVAHSFDEIVRVYVLGEPWHEVIRY